MARNTNFNEDGRVKYPAMVHLIRLGLSLLQTKRS
jgi:hypothetical protein